MYLHEFQAKKILKDNMILIPNSYLITNEEDIKNIKKYIKSEKIVLKAQIHSGARGKFGGIKIVKNDVKIVHDEIKNMLNKNLITNQTGIKGKKITKILIEEFIKIDKELYFSLYLDRTLESIILIFSNDGGKNIEDTNNTTFLKMKCDINYNIQDYHVRNIIYFLNLDINDFNYIKETMKKFTKIFIENDLLLLEINPLAIINNKFYCIDSKIECDDNASYRNRKIFDDYDTTQDDEIEIKAKKLNLNYISLNGNIGCLVNGAGLAMATMDLLKIYKGEPANFLDIGGNANEKTILNALELICSNKNLKGIFINIFGGIVRCDLIADTLINIFNTTNITIPIVIRLAGNMSKKGLEKINNSKIKIITESDLETAVIKITNLIKEA